MVTSTSAVVLQACEEGLHNSSPTNSDNHANNTNHANHTDHAHNAHYAHHANNADHSYNPDYNQDDFTVQGYRGEAFALLLRCGKAGL